MANCKTTIRMGAAHCDLEMRVGDVSSRVNLAEVLHGLHPRDRNSRLSGVAAIICKAHGIVLKHSPHAPPLAPRKGKKVRKATPLPYAFISPVDITMEATL